ncbi:MAG TPA: magnesium chelatase ATPase subunit D [Blastocatellia bacterium]|nr:magnesium chelatase ATPase subunit D [Blastocatellia bacterium]
MIVTGNQTDTPDHAEPLSRGGSTTLPDYPFAAVVGHETARLALMLLAVEPRLKGVLIGAAPGSAKTTLARAFRPIFQALFEDIRPFVEVPLNVSEDRLLGSIDIERAIVTGRKHLARGLLFQADKGVLLVDNANLLDGGIANHIAAALDAGEARIEREGLSVSARSDFMLVGTFNPGEGEVSPRLRNAAGLIVEDAAMSSPDCRVEIIRRASAFIASPKKFGAQFEEADDAIVRAVASARERLPHVGISRDSIRKLGLSALALGIEGNGCDLVAVRAARASAALAGRGEVTEPDLIAAIQLVLAPRAERLPEPGGGSNNGDEHAPVDEREPDGLPPDDEGPDAQSSIDESEEAAAPELDLSRQAEELVVRALDSDAVGLNTALSGKSMRSSTASGRRALAQSTSRGRHVRDSDVKQPAFKIAVAATLRAAAPFQNRRKERAKEEATPDIEGCGSGRTKGDPVKIEPSDLRFKQFKRRAGMLFIFAIDGSGSMAINRMAQAKGAMIRLLREAYLHRDKLALISFRGSSAEVLMAPTRSVEVAKRLIDALPSGGGTPLGAGLIRSLDVARLARLRKMSQALVVIFTDGRANVGVGDAGPSGKPHAAGRIADELKRIGASFQLEGVESIVIDTRSKYLSQGEGQELARLLRGRYLYLPRPDSASIYKAVTSVAASMRAGPSVQS